MAASYRATLADFLRQSLKEILGSPPDSSKQNESEKRQTKVRGTEIKVLKTAFDELVRRLPAAAEWSLLLEYPVPRRPKPLDAVLLAAGVIFCFEFRTEDTDHSPQSQRQIEDYALDLRDFHQATADRQIVPVVVIPKAASAENSGRKTSDGPVRDVLLANATDLASVLLTAFESEHQNARNPIDPKVWDNSLYRPVPTILEAAEELFAGHDVREMMRCQTGSANLTDTSDRLVDIIQQAQKRSEKVVCFVTGAPGAGKTLTGLNLVRHPALQRDGRPTALFLSGNSPLVKIVSAALSHNGDKPRVPSFIQNAHTFVKERVGKSENPPAEKIIVFDEAQRAWNASQNRKKNRLQFSEPEALLSFMNRHNDWAVLVALIGGNHASHSGEAGLSEWGKTLREKFPDWKVAVSPNALDGNGSNGGHRLFEGGNSGAVTIRKELFLHLKTGQRSFRAQRLTEWVDAVLSGDSEKAATILPKLRDFPLELTRSLSIARGWLKRHARGQQRAGLVASSGAVRLRPDGLELSSAFRQGNRNMYVHWFLAPPLDIRSSNQLEVAASEIECQGLELDWVGLCWGGDLAFDKAINQWRYRQFSGSNWAGLKNENDREYLLNTYRVLLTRARRGLIIWVPNGDTSDRTRSPKLSDPTVEYLVRCGLSVL